MKWKPRPEYEAKKAAITDTDFLGRLALAEEAAVTDPIHRQRREEIDGIVFDRNEEGVMLTFTVDGDMVVGLSFADLWNS